MADFCDAVRFREFEKLIVEESEKWAKEFLGIKANDRRQQL